MCPSTATVTSFFTFSPGTKAKSSEMNTNNQTWRGFLLPVNTDTTTASDNTHDLGAPDHRWRRIYVADAPYITAQTANSFWAGPTTGAAAAPTFRAMDFQDVKSIQAISVINFQNFS